MGLPDRGALGDSCEPARHIAENSERMAMRQGFASCVQNTRRSRILLDSSESLGSQTSLSKARGTDDRHDDRRLVLDAALERRNHLQQLCVAANERNPGRGVAMQDGLCSDDCGSICAIVDSEPPAS
jgi:hypothetical protein